MISINTNLSSLIVQSNLKNSTVGLNNAIQRMTSGFKINGAKDNAAGYSISTSLSTKIGAYQIAEDNVSMGLDMVQTASNSLSQMSDLTSRLRSLAVQASNGTYGNSSLDSINSEAQAIVQELHRIQNTTSYNGITLLNGGTKTNSATSPIAVLAASAQTTSSPKAGASGFIEEVQRRDTSAMTTLASVDENTTISSGTYSISTAEELAKLATMANSGRITGNAEFVLANDIDLSAYSTGEGWTPIGKGSSARFAGTFDGNGYKVKNLYINRPNSNMQGLFGYLNSDTTIKNVGVENVNVTGKGSVGGLVGYGKYATITNSYVTGNVTGQSAQVGGLVGNGYSATISNSYSTGSVAGQGSDAGGLVGDGQDATISNSYSTGSVTGNDFVGGLVGDGDGSTIINSYSTGSVTGDDNVGGLVGRAWIGSITNSYSTGSVTGSSFVGGLVGDGESSDITNSYSTSSVTGNNFVGGLVGDGQEGYITNSYSTGSVTGNNNVGGLAGRGEDATISNSYSTSGVMGNSSVGGLVGNGEDATISNSYSTGSVTGQGYSVGGLVGDGEDVTISNSYTTGSVTGKSSVGGLVGYGTDATLDNTYYVDESGQTVGIGYGTPKSGTATKVTQKELKELIAQGILPNYLAPDLELTLQVGIHGDDSSQIGLTFSQLDISSLDGLSMSNKNAVDTIDEVLKSINEQQTNFGSAENRLMSALEQISVAYDNLVSSRSTIRDADIAQESSNYIKMQILQQASATLLATANQNPSIALQLI